MQSNLSMDKNRMNLSEYLTAENITVEEFSVLVGVNNSSMYRWLHGGGIDGEHLRRLSEASGGKIDPLCVVKEIAQAKAAKRTAKKRAA